MGLSPRVWVMAYRGAHPTSLFLRRQCVEGWGPFFTGLTKLHNFDLCCLLYAY